MPVDHPDMLLLQGRSGAVQAQGGISARSRALLIQARTILHAQRHRKHKRKNSCTHWVVRPTIPFVHTFGSLEQVGVGTSTVYNQRRNGIPKYHSQSLLQNHYLEVLNATSLFFSLSSSSWVVVPSFFSITSSESRVRADVDSY